MRIFVAIILLFTSLSSLGSEVEKKQLLSVTAKFPGAALLWVKIAQIEFEKNKFNLNEYDISIIEGDDITVVLSKGDILNGVRGNLSGSVNFEVRISRSTKKILSASYVR